MKCISCNQDNMLRDRQNGKCSRCSHPFVFDPRRTSDKFNDVQFKRTLESISVSGTLKFTVEQFQYFLNRRKFLEPKLLTTTMFLTGFFGAILSIPFSSIPKAGPYILLIYWFLIFPLIIFAAYRKQKELERRPPINFSLRQVQTYLSSWEATNGLIPTLLPGPDKLIKSDSSVPDEVLDYSFDRLIVTQTDDIAYFLISNNFHFENNCAVLSINQYPTKVFYTVMKMLRNNDALKVYTLHDCSWTGLKMLDKLSSDPVWFGEQTSAQIIDLGLLPRQIMNKKPFMEAVSPYELDEVKNVSEKVRNALTEEEKKWLSQNLVKMSSVAPQALLRMINAGIAKSRDPEEANALVAVDDSGHDGGIYMYSVDSFG